VEGAWIGRKDRVIVTSVIHLERLDRDRVCDCLAEKRIIGGGRRLGFGGSNEEREQMGMRLDERPALVMTV
jgi:hypothetical protein